MTRRPDDFRRGLNLSAVDEDVRAEILEEIQFYLERRSEEFMEEGIPKAEAWPVCKTRQMVSLGPIYTFGSPIASSASPSLSATLHPWIIAAN